MLERDTYLFKKIALGLLFIQGKKKKKKHKDISLSLEGSKGASLWENCLFKQNYYGIS